MLIAQVLWPMWVDVNRIARAVQKSRNLFDQESSYPENIPVSYF